MITWTSCVTDYDFDPDETEVRVVINGRITQHSGPYDVFVSTSTTYGILKRAPVNGAEIVIYDDQGNSETFWEIEEGMYRCRGLEVQGCSGYSYFIEVSLPTGHTYRSIPEKMPSVFEPDLLQVEPVIVKEINSDGTIVDNKILNVYINTPIRNGSERALLRWSTETVFSFTESYCSFSANPRTCYISNLNNPEEIVIFNGENVDADYLEHYYVANKNFMPQHHFQQRHYFNVAQLSMTKAAYEYWRKVKVIAQPSGSIFEIPPAPIRGNIYRIDDDSELVLGYFEAAAVDTIRAFTTPGDFPWNVSYNSYCGVYFNTENCCNCLLFHNSTLETPSYWFE
jgi:hypothetical protein